MELVVLREQLSHLTNRVNHLETELKASSPDGELKQLTIDWVRWSDDLNLRLAFGDAARDPILLCHVAEWDGYARMLRFTRKADHVFTIAAPGHAPLEARMEEGGICDDHGDTRFVLLSLRGQSQLVQRGVEYALHPRNQGSEYKWVVPDQVIVTSPADGTTPGDVPPAFSGPGRGGAVLGGQ